MEPCTRAADVAGSFDKVSTHDLGWQRMLSSKSASTREAAGVDDRPKEVLSIGPSVDSTIWLFARQIK